MNCGNIFQRPSRPDRAQDRLHVAGRTADELARHQLAVGDDGALVLADRLAVADDALVGVHGEEDEVRADLRPAGPVELLRERDRERRRLDAGDLHRKLLQPEEVDGRPAARGSPATISCSRASSAAAAACTSARVGGGDDRDAVGVGAHEVAGLDGDSAELDRDAEGAGAVLPGPARRAAEEEDREPEPAISTRSRIAPSSDDARDPALRARRAR